ncbi:MAG: peptidylprolyl isomerase [Oscillospiraceae bacterium]|nr:peptidylprolyl isomerase [Oscillospiraceae bacterium]
MKKRFIRARGPILAVCFALALAVPGCAPGNAAVTDEGTPPQPTPTATDENTPPDAGSDATGGGDEIPADTGEPDFAAARAALPAERAVMNVNGEDILWDEYFFAVYANISNALSYYEPYSEPLPGWDYEIMEGVTFKDYINDAIYNELITYRAVDAGAKELNISLSEGDLAEIDAQLAEMEEALGSKEALDKYFADIFCSEKLYRRMMETSLLHGLCFDALYGEGGERLPASDLEQFAAGSDFLMAKHILTFTIDPATNAPLPDDEIALARQEAEDILAELDGYSGDGFGAFFDELMNARSADTGLQSNPGGYLFTAGDMVPEFEEAARALEVGGYSRIVESSFGFHIIYRIPIDYDASPSSQPNYTLRYLAALDMFDRTAMETWRSSLSVTLSAEYEDLDLAEMFGS